MGDAKKKTEAPPAPASDKPGTEAPPAPASSPLDHPISCAFAFLVAAREELVRARAGRGPDAEVVSDAGVLARSLLLIGGALPDDSEPWALAHALAEMSGIADEDGTDLFVRFTSFVSSTLYATRRRKALALPAPGLERFADMASKLATRKLVIEAIEASRKVDQRERDAKSAVAHDARGARLVAPNPPAPSDLPPNPLLTDPVEPRV